MNNKKHKQQVIPTANLPEEWKGVKLQQLKTIILNHIRNNFSGMIIQNDDTGLPVIISISSARKLHTEKLSILRKPQQYSFSPTSSNTPYTTTGETAKPQTALI